MNLGSCYYKGKGVSRDYGEAVKLYRKAALQGNAIAQYNLGICYEYGDGVPRDREEANRWYKMAAGQGDGTPKTDRDDVYYKR